MANLVCWASGLLEILMDKDTPTDSGPVVLAHGPRSRMCSLMVAHGEQRTSEDSHGRTAFQWYVPGTKPVPKDSDEAALVQRDNMTLVIQFNKKILPPALKRRLIE